MGFRRTGRQSSVNCSLQIRDEYGAVDAVLAARVFNRVERTDGAADAFQLVFQKNCDGRRPFPHHFINDIVSGERHGPALLQAEHDNLFHIKIVALTQIRAKIGA
jgi:hypothetical protein